MPTGDNVKTGAVAAGLVAVMQALAALPWSSIWAAVSCH